MSLTCGDKGNTDFFQAVKTENGDENSSVAPTANEDTEMAEGSMAATDDEGGEDGEEGDEGDDDEGSVSAVDSPSKPLRPFSPGISDLSHMRETSNISSADIDMSGMDDLPGPPLPSPLPKLEMSEGKSGSPLKNVALTTSALASPVKSPDTAPAPFSNILPPQELGDTPEVAERAALNEGMQQEATETAPPALPPPPPAPLVAEVAAALETRQEEEEEGEMLLDIVKNTNNANIGVSQDSVPVTLEVSAEIILAAQQSESSISKQEPGMPNLPAVIEESAVEGAVEQPAEEEEEFTDLLGGLEKQLNEPQAAPLAQSEPAPKVSETQAELEKAIDPAAQVTEAVTETKEKVEEVKEDAEAA